MVDILDILLFIVVAVIVLAVASVYKKDEHSMHIESGSDKEIYTETPITTEPSESTTPREPISDKVKIFVWNRDGGKCVNCGSNEKLEYDHIIPLSKGGSNTARNIQLLCENCNRSKGANIVNEPVNETVIVKPSTTVSLQELKDELAKINEVRDELDETLAQGEITEAKYKELVEKYRVEADNLKNQIADKKFMQPI